MPVSKPNRRWSPRRRQQERHSVAPWTEGPPPGGDDLIATGRSPFDPVNNLGRSWNFRLALYNAARSRTRPVGPRWFWAVFGGVLLLGSLSLLILEMTAMFGLASLALLVAALAMLGALRIIATELAKALHKRSAGRKVERDLRRER